MGDIDCSPLEQNGAEVAVGIILCIGVFASYIPQWVAFVRARSGQGVSMYMLFVGSVSSMTGLITAVVLQFRRFYCCPLWGPSLCGESLLGIIQLFCLVFGYTPSFVIYMIFNPHRATDRKKYLISGVLFCMYIFISIVFWGIAGALLAFNGIESTGTLAFGDGLGIFTIVCTLVQWMPQIILTARNRSVGALSIPMLCVQIPGAVLFVLYQSVIEEEAPLTWAPYTVACAQQSVLLAMCVVFKLREIYQRRRKGAGLTAEAPEAGAAPPKSYGSIQRAGAPHTYAYSVGTPARSSIHQADALDAVDDAQFERAALLHDSTGGSGPL